MSGYPIFSRLSVRLTLAFIFSAVLGVALVAVLVYRTTASEFNTFVSHWQAMQQMMGGGGMGGMMGDPAFVQAQDTFLDNLGRGLWVAGLAGIALAILLGYIFTQQIVAPLSKVSDAARQVSLGNLDQKVDAHGSGEIVELGESFNQMAAALSHDRKLRQNMVADIAHELRTPLTILQGNIEAMQDGVLPANRENLESIHQETVNLARLVDDLRTLSLADSGQLKIQPSSTDMKQLASHVIGGFQTQAAAKKVALRLEAPGDLPPAFVDPDRTAQVVRNLIGNALNFTPEGGNITVKLVSDNKGVTVSVTDTGIGISAEDLPYVFDRFYRVDRSRARSTGGSGLGLAIVKQLIEAQDGRVRVESKEGKGSTFSFFVPYSSEQ